jgi:cytochrome P450
MLNDPYLWVGLAVIGGSTMYLLAWQRQRQLFCSLWTPPGAVPVLGHGIQIGLSDNPENPMLWIADQSKKNGFRPWFMRGLWLDYLLVISDPKTISEILVNNKDFPRSYHFDVDNQVIGGNVLFAIKGSLWSYHRKLLNPFFATSKQRSIFTIVQAVAIKATRILDEHCESFQVLDLKSIVSKLMCDVICSYIFGNDFGCLNGDEHGVNDFYSACQREVTLANKIPFYLYLPPEQDLLRPAAKEVL